MENILTTPEADRRRRELQRAWTMGHDVGRGLVRAATSSGSTHVATLNFKRAVTNEWLPEDLAERYQYLMGFSAGLQAEAVANTALVSADARAQDVIR